MKLELCITAQARVNLKVHVGYHMAKVVLYVVSCLGTMNIVYALVTALVECWR